MSTTPNLGLSHIHANQGQKEVTANQFADGLDIAIAGSIVINLEGKTEYMLNTIEARHAILIFKGGLISAVNIIIPTENANKKFIVHHAAVGDFPIHIHHPNSVSIAIQPDERCWIYSDGEQFYTLSD